MADQNAVTIQNEDAIAIVGVGLIGGSIAAALKSRGHSGPVIGVGRSAERLEKARSLGLIDAAFTSNSDAAGQADWIVFCTPVDRIVAGVEDAAHHCRPGTLITDAGSVKSEICLPLEDGLPNGATFVGSHPLAGSEKQGFKNADAELFQDRVCVVTPTESTPTSAIDRVKSFWQFLGMKVIVMSPGDHDRSLAETSHLPHLTASALALCLQEFNRPLAATGFRDSTRIASGDADLWTAIFLANADAVLQSLERYRGQLDDFEAALRVRDAAALHELLQQAKSNRDELS